jgi:hypothetical protein
MMDQALAQVDRSLGRSRAFLRIRLGYSLEPDLTADRAHEVAAEVVALLARLPAAEQRRIRIAAAPVLAEMTRAIADLSVWRDDYSNRIARAGRHRAAAVAYVKGRVSTRAK